MPRVAKRYFSAEDVESGVTPSQLKRISKQRQLAYLAWWFHSYYEDPAQETPYNGREGGYLYIHGGPYNSRDELHDEFGDVVSEDVIERATEELESDGIYDWAPTSAHPVRKDEGQDFEPLGEFDELEEVLRQLAAGVLPEYGSERERGLRQEVLRDLDDIELELPSEGPEHGGIGHNNPPLDERFTAEELAELRKATLTIRVEIAKNKPDAKQVAEATSLIRTTGRWLGKKLDIGIDAFVKTAATAGATAMVASVALNGPSIYNALTSLSSRLIEWLTIVVPPPF